eukprot:m.95863 g.95863  ORF g.95863 m.95863 type:complete len:1511 (+) comp26850_c1_seq1:214-4746(+)
MFNGTSGRDKQLVDALTTDLHALVSESKKKCPNIKLAAERGLLRLRSIGPGNDNVIQAIAQSEDIFQTFSLGCEEIKHPRVVQLSTNCLHRLITNNAMLPATTVPTLDILSKLIDAGLEELKILQCILALVTNPLALRGELLCKGISLCFKLKGNKDPQTAAIAAATLRQIVTAIFERVEVEDRLAETSRNAVQQARRHSHAPANLLQAASDAYLLFQDLCLLTNSDLPHWLMGGYVISQTFGLELIETALAGSPSLFFKHPEFTFLLKERVCSLVIRLFSPSIKHAEQTQKVKGLLFPVMIRLLRITATLITSFRDILATESEIFLSMLIRFLEADKPIWQRVTSLEVIHQFCANPELLQWLSQNYDTNPKSTNVFQDLVSSVAGLCKSVIDDPNRGELVIEGPRTMSKGTYIEMLEKQDAPTINEAYGISVAFGCMLDTIKSISSLVNMPLPAQHGAKIAPIAEEDKGNAEVKLPGVLHVMVSSSFEGLVSALSLLLDRSESSTVIDPILKHFTSFVRVCGVLKLPQRRDRLLIVIATNSIPPKFTITADTSLNSFQVSDKNLHCVHALTNTALCLGGVMDDGWRLVMVTLQQLVALVNPPNPVSGMGHGVLGSAARKVQRGHGHRRTGSGTLTLAPLAGQAAEIMAIGSLMQQLFESSRQLDNAGLEFIMQAACAVSEKTLEILPTASVNSAIFQNNAHLFPVVKILEIGLLNLERVMVFWPLVTAHLIEVATHPSAELREAGLDALTKLVVSALSHPRTPPIQDCPGLQQAILSPLRNLSSCESVVAQKRQLECVLQVMDSCGDSLKHAWPVVIGIINDALATTRPEPSQTSMQIAFDSIRMVVTDFLPTIPVSSYPLLLTTISNFGKQNVDVNICLTAIALLWNLSDDVARHKTRGDAGDDEESTAEIWMLLFSTLAELCVDKRSEVRKSANQTLFATITTHGHLLAGETWHELLWDVLFKLLNEVIQLSRVAVNTKPTNENKGIMVHHSRDTAAKQWDETKVIAITGAAKVFTAFYRTLSTLQDFYEAWESLLLIIESSAVDASKEVARAAVSAMQELFRVPPASDNTATVAAAPEMWRAATDAFFKIAAHAVTRRPLPFESYFAGILDSFPLLYRHIYQNFTEADAKRLLACVRDIADLQHHDALTMSAMTICQQSLITLTVCLIPNDTDTVGNVELVPIVLKELAIYASLGCDPPPPPMTNGKPERKPRHGACVPLALAAMDALSTVYSRYCDLPVVLETGVASHILTVLSIPMTRKYDCPSTLLWRRAVGTFVSVVHTSVSGTSLHASLKSPDAAIAERTQALWQKIVQVLESALFTDVPPPAELSSDEREADAALDVELVHVIRDALLKADEALDTTYTSKLYMLLRRGSVVASQSTDASLGMRGQDLARESFQTLLNASLTSSNSSLALINSCEDVLQRCISESSASELSPERIKEAVYVLQAVMPLITTKRHSIALRLFPLLVGCISCTSDEVRNTVRDALQLYQPLLRMQAASESDA